MPPRRAAGKSPSRSTEEAHREPSDRIAHAQSPIARLQLGVRDGHDPDNLIAEVVHDRKRESLHHEPAYLSTGNDAV